MSRILLGLSALLALASPALLGVGRAGDPPAQGQKLRIGTYDSRAIAVAYAPSRFNPVKEKMADYEKAKAAGDEATMKELRAWGERHQRQLHLQGFGRAPVDDLLAPVKDQVARIARRQRLAAVAMSYEYTSAEVEVVDITDDLVKLYAPSDKTLERVTAIRKTTPTPLAQIDAGAGRR